jgi:serine/threonine-protein kinase
MIGQKLGQYEIESKLGAGGMGEVYQARDTRLGRGVAIKVLTEAFAKDPERIARFEREAKVLASLNHSNIAALHGFEQSGDAHFLVMELVQGETLAERVARGPIPTEEALPIAQQIAEALEAAHEKGVVHRDLKPANVKITPEGKVKVLDFGLAKAMESSPAYTNLSNSPTLSVMATNAGMILGTAAYMSPEQARGENTDARSDVFSFGCVFYEMLPGRRVSRKNRFRHPGVRTRAGVGLLITAAEAQSENLAAYPARRRKGTEAPLASRRRYACRDRSRDGGSI